MPSDFVTEFRQRFVELESRMAGATYLFESGRRLRLETDFHDIEYSDLWSTATIATLRDEIHSAHREVDRIELERFLCFAHSKRTAYLVRELSDEIEQWESAATLMWEGGKLDLAESRRLCISDSDPNRRSDLRSRVDGKESECDDLRAERFEALRDAAVKLGFANHLDLQQQIRRIDFGSLATSAQPILAGTLARFREAMANLLPGTANVRLSEATITDIYHALSLDSFSQVFPGWRILHALRETYSGLGIHLYNQPNLLIEASTAILPGRHATCFPLQVPDEIKVICPSGDGAPLFIEIFQAVSRGEQFAWTSPQLPAAFQRLRDESVTEGFGLLFVSLFREERWLGDILGFHEAGALKHSLALRRLLEVRLQVAGMMFENEFHSGLTPEVWRSRFNELSGEASCTDTDYPGFLAEVRDDSRAAVMLRAAAFECQLREYLKVRFGSRWWTSRRAGDFLIEVWNAGGRHDAEELARLIDVGDLSYDWLAEEMARDIKD